MTMSRTWIRGPLLGAAIGLPVLGLGGRLAMRAIAVRSAAPLTGTVEGTLKVLLAGAASGTIAGGVYALLAWLLPSRRTLRVCTFALLLTAVTLRGLHPVQPYPLALFTPLVVLFGVVFEAAWHRWLPVDERAEAVA
jgi:hypothetical protein